MFSGLTTWGRAVGVSGMASCFRNTEWVRVVHIPPWLLETPAEGDGHVGRRWRSFTPALLRVVSGEIGRRRTTSNPPPVCIKQLSNLERFFCFEIIKSPRFVADLFVTATLPYNLPAIAFARAFMSARQPPFCYCVWQLLDRIGDVHFGIKPPQAGGLMGMLGQLMGGM